MNLQIRDREYEEIRDTATATEDRRIHERLTLMKTMHISCVDSEHMQETATVVDISREGLYFTVRPGQYRVGMEMKVAIPSLGFEGLCRLVRIEELPNGDLGVGGIVLGW